MLRRNLSTLPMPKAPVSSQNKSKKNDQNTQSNKPTSQKLSQFSYSINDSKQRTKTNNKSVHFDLSNSKHSMHESIHAPSLHNPHQQESPSQNPNPKSPNQSYSNNPLLDRPQHMTASHFSKNASKFADPPHKCVYKTVESLPKEASLDSVSNFSEAKDELLLEPLYTLKKFCVENDCSFQELFRMFDSQQKGFLTFEDFFQKVSGLGIEKDKEKVRFCFIYLDRNAAGKLFEPVFIQILSQF